MDSTPAYYFLTALSGSLINFSRILGDNTSGASLTCRVRRGSDDIFKVPIRRISDVVSVDALGASDCDWKPETGKLVSLLGLWSPTLLAEFESANTWESFGVNLCLLPVLKLVPEALWTSTTCL